MVLRVLTRPYKTFLNDIWSTGIDEPAGNSPDAPVGDYPVATLYNQTITVGVASFYNNRIAYVSDWYAKLTGKTVVGSSTGDKMAIQVVSHGVLSLNRFEITFNVPVKSCKVNGLVIGQNFLNQVQGFFTFIVDSIAGYESLYNLADGAVLVVTEIKPFGEGN